MTLLSWSRLRRLLPAALLALMAGLLILSSLHKPLSYDEFDNLAYGYRFLTQGPGADPIGQRMPILVLNALPCLPSGCRQAEINGSETALLGVRFPSLAFTLALGLLLYRWAGTLLGAEAALACLWLYVFNPNFLAHGKQVGSDVQTSFFMAAAVHAFCRLARRPSARGFLACALATTGALASKFTGLLLFPTFAVLLVLRIRDASGRDRQPVGRVTLKAAGGFAALCLAVLLLLNAVYLFKGTFLRASDYNWRSRSFQLLRSVPLPVPLPRVFAQGLDYSGYVQEHPEVGRGWNYVLGRLSHEGAWYAFPLMLLLKTPLALFVLLFLAARSASAADADGAAALLVPFGIVLVFFSLFVEPQLGIRYILPGLTFPILYAGRAARRWGEERGRIVLALLLGWHALSTLSYHPHYMSYFNELIGPRVNAYRYLADSNLDWEDRTWFIARFQEGHPEMPLVVEPPQPRPGFVLVGANQLVGIYDEERFRWLRENFTPLRHVAYSHLLFDVSPERLRQLGLD